MQYAGLKVTAAFHSRLHAISPPLSARQRQEIESRLANYSIPLQILQMVAEHCDCGAISERTEARGSGRDLKNSRILAALNDKSIALLQQIFLDCHDSFSNFRLAVFLSSRWRMSAYKFVLGGRINGKSGREYIFDVCIYNRSTEELVALGKQNNSADQGAASNEVLRQFLSAVDDLRAAHPALQSASYASSYGYKDANPCRLVKQVHKYANHDLEIRLLEYKNTVYFEKS